MPLVVEPPARSAEVMPGPPQSPPPEAKKAEAPKQ
jgi:hypothetical protein